MHDAKLRACRMYKLRNLSGSLERVKNVDVFNALFKIIISSNILLPCLFTQELKVSMDQALIPIQNSFQFHKTQKDCSSTLQASHQVSRKMSELLMMCRPGSASGRDDIFPASLRNATMEPVKVTPPVNDCQYTRNTNKRLATDR